MDPIFDLIDKEQNRQERGLELIASENFVSQHVMKAMGSILTNKYAEGLPFKRYYGGCEIVDQIEQLAIERAKELFQVDWVNVQPHSGSQANAAVMLGVLDAGDTILGFDLSHGGHLTHGASVNFSGKTYQPQFYGIEEGSGLVDMQQVEDQAKKHKPKLIICGASSYSRDWDYARFREIADEVGAVLMADISHPSGLIAKGLLNQPQEHCHILTTTTHKTLRGPRGGMIMVGNNTDNPMGKTTMKGKIRSIGAVLDSAVFPGTQGGPLEHVIGAKAVAFGEALSDSYHVYCKQVIKNANALANAFIKKGYHVISGGTENHLMLIDLRTKFEDVTGKMAESALEDCDITINKNSVPNESRSPMVTSGIRIGSPAITTRGLVESHMDWIVERIDKVLNHVNDDDVKSEVKSEVNGLMSKFSLYSSV